VTQPAIGCCGSIPASSAKIVSIDVEILLTGEDVESQAARRSDTVLTLAVALWGRSFARCNRWGDNALNVVNLPKISNCLLLGFQKLSHTVKVCDSAIGVWQLVH
jgi:hypothetical protein